MELLVLLVLIVILYIAIISIAMMILVMITIIMIPHHLEKGFEIASVESAQSLSQYSTTCPLHTNSGCGKERRILIGPWSPVKAALVRNYLEVYWPRGGGLSAVVVVVVVVVSHIQRIGCQPEKNYFTR